MSATDDGPGTREVARRLFATEYEDASLSYSESEEERAPNYVITPTGARVNRMFVAGVFTEAEQVNEDMLRARIVDPTGAFVSYAGQYQPEALSFFERTNPPEFVAMTGKARTFQPEDSDRVFTSVRPESVNAVDADTRDRWAISAAESTLRRVAAYDVALDTGLQGEDLADYLREQGVDESLATGVPLAIDHYGTTRAYLEAVRQVAVDALEVVAGEREEVRGLELAPDEGGEAEIGPIPEEFVIEGGAPAGTAETGEPAESTAEAETAESTTKAETAESAPSASEPSTGETESADGTRGAAESAEAETEAEVEDEVEAEVEDEAESEAEPEAGFDSEDIETAGEESGEEPVAAENEVSVEAETTETTPGELGEEAETMGEESGGLGEELGDFESGGEEQEVPAAEAEEVEEAADLDEEGMYELDEEERREVEEEFGVEFSSGSEVGEPGEAGIETPEPEAEDVEAETTEAGPEEPGEAAEDVAAEAEETAGNEAESGEEAAESEPEPAESVEVDLESVAVEKMAELDDGNGAQREKVIAAVVDEYGADPGAVDDAIQDALMDGRCYEPGDDRLKAI